MGLIGKLFGAKGPSHEIADVYRDMRAQVLELADRRPTSSGADEGGGVLAVMMDTSQADFGYSLVAVDDGTLSLYLSNGGGTIGSGQWQKVGRSAKAFVSEAGSFLEHCQPGSEASLPPAGHVAFHLVTSQGLRSVCHKEDDLGNDKLALSPLFHRAHHLVSMIRHVSELEEREHRLVFAAELGEAELARSEIQNGADANMRSSSGSPVAAIATQSDEAELLQVLCEAGADANVRVAREPGESADSPLICLAAALQEPACLRILLGAGADIEAQDPTGLSALHVASYLGNEAVVAALREHGAQLESREESGYTPLMMAANASKAACVRALLEAGAQPNAADRDGSTPLMFAAQHGVAEVVELLLAAGADPTVRGSHGLDAIGFAGQNGHAEVEAMLRR